MIAGVSMEAGREAVAPVGERPLRVLATGRGAAARFHGAGS